MYSSLDLLQLTIKEIILSHGHVAWFLVGGYNARVGPLGKIPRDIILGNNLTEQRVFFDLKIDAKGRKLHNLMNNNFLVLVNSWSLSDSSGKIIFIGNGHSAIDYVRANIQSLEFIKDMEVLQTENPFDHIPTFLQLYHPSATFSSDHSASPVKVFKIIYP